MRNLILAALFLASVPCAAFAADTASITYHLEGSGPVNATSGVMTGYLNSFTFNLDSAGEMALPAAVGPSGYYGVYSSWMATGPGTTIIDSYVAYDWTLGTGPQFYLLGESVGAAALDAFDVPAGCGPENNFQISSQITSAGTMRANWFAQGSFKTLGDGDAAGSTPGLPNPFDPLGYPAAKAAPDYAAGLPYTPLAQDALGTLWNLVVGNGVISVDGKTWIDCGDPGVYGASRDVSVIWDDSGTGWIRHLAQASEAQGPTLSLSLAPGSECAAPGQTVTVLLNQSDIAPWSSAGFQAFLKFDPASLSITSGAITLPSDPYGTVLLKTVTGNKIDLAAGITPPSQQPTQDDAVLATLEFVAGTQEGYTQVWFRTNTFPSRFTDINGDSIPTYLVMSPPILIDATAPVITCPADATVECEDSTDPAATGVATAVDNYDPEPEIGYSDEIEAGACPQSYVIKRTWTAEDNCGNSSACVQLINVVDTTAPVFTVVPDGQTVNADENCEAPVPDFASLAEAEDICDPSVTITQDPIAGSMVSGGIHQITLTATDACGNSTTAVVELTVVDAIAPTIECPSAVSVNNDPGQCFATAVDLGTPLTADNCGVATVENDAPEQFPVGDTTVTWTVTDTSGLTATCQQTVTVTDNEAPTITCPADVQVDNDAGQCYATGVVLGTPETADNCGVADTTDDAPAQFPVGETIVTWTVTDIHGNSGTCAQKVTVIDAEDPTITCQPDVEVPFVPAGQCYAEGVDLGAPVAADNCGVDTVASDAPAQFPVGETSVTWTATDAAGNSATCVQKVIVANATRVVVDIEIEGMEAADGSLSRCIEMSFGGSGGSVGPVQFSTEVVFTNAAGPTRGVASGVEYVIPACEGGQVVNWSCASAKDPKHTLRRTISGSPSLEIAGGKYYVAFSGANRLLGGDLSGDNQVDILDYGAFVGQYGQNVGKDTPCGYGARHADCSGNGVVGSEDFTFIFNRFLTIGDQACGGVSLAEVQTPRTRVAVRELRELGLARMIWADLNRDGYLDVSDMKLFFRARRGR